MTTKKPAKRPSLAVFDESTLDRLVESALTRIAALETDLAKEGAVLKSERGPVPNPKVKILRDEREWVRKAWSTKFQGQSDAKKESNYFGAGPQEA